MNDETTRSSSPDADRLRHAAVGKLQEGRPAEARALLLQALGARPNDARLHAGLGQACLMLGQADKARRALRQATRLAPGWAKGWLLLGEALAPQDQARAAESFRRATELEPRNAEAWMKLGDCLLRQGRRDQALAAFAAAGGVGGVADMLAAMGSIMEAKGEREDAHALLRSAVLLAPDSALAHDNLGVALLSLGRAAEAEAAHRHALELGSKLAASHSNLGNSLHRQGRLEEAEACYRRAVALEPATRKFHTNLALNLLLQGKRDEGWREYEWRWRGDPGLPAHLRGETWQGQDLGGGTLLLQAEQGFGDTIQYVRYAAQMKQRGVGRVVLAAQAPLVRLLSGLPWLDQVVPEGQVPAHDAAQLTMSLPGILGPAEWPGPYLAAPEGGPQLEAAPGLKVGLAWAGRPVHGDDWNRSVPFDRLAPLLRLKGLSFYNLQHGAVAPRLGGPAPGQLRPAVETCTDFADTAGIVAQLDLVVTVDTAIAHLAGAMGKPVWVLLPPVPDFRWGMAGESTPLYPSMRLYRRAQGGGWDQVLLRLADDIREFSL